MVYFQFEPVSVFFGKDSVVIGSDFRVGEMKTNIIETIEAVYKPGEDKAAAERHDKRRDLRQCNEQAVARADSGTDHLGANAIITCRGRLLLEKRRDSDIWGLVGGGCKKTSMATFRA